MEGRFYCVEYYNTEINHIVYTVREDGRYFRFDDEIPHYRLLTRSEAVRIETALKKKGFSDTGIQRVIYWDIYRYEKRFVVKYYYDKLDQSVYTVTENGSYWRNTAHIDPKNFLNLDQAIALEDVLRRKNYPKTCVVRLEHY